jgi:outer membrane protein assembly factor BamB
MNIKKNILLKISNSIVILLFLNIIIIDSTISYNKNIKPCSILFDTTINNIIWNSYRYDTNNSGLNNNTYQNNNGRIIWKINIDGNISEGSPLITGNYIIVSTDNSILICSKNGTIIRKIDRFRNINGPPVIYNDNIIFGANDKLISIKINGSIDWISEVDDQIRSPISVNNGKIYFGTESSLNCYNLNGSLSWIYYTGYTINTIPSFDMDRNIFFGCVNNNMYSLFFNGTIRWTFPVSRPISNSSPLIDNNGNLYFGSMDSFFYSLFNNGTERWKFKTNDEIFSSAALFKQKVFFGSDDGNLHALFINGSFNWNYKTDSIIRSSPIIDSNGTIYFASRNGDIYSMNNNGTIKWKIQTFEDIYYNSPSIDNSGVIFITTLNALYAIGNKHPSIINQVKIMSGNKFINTSWDLPIDDGGAEILNFNVYRNTSGNDPELYTSVPANKLFFNDTNVINVVEYSYWISAENREGESELAGPFNATPRGPPSTPRNVTVSSGPAYLNISWEGPLSNGGYSIEGYKIYRKDAGVFLLHGETTDLFYIDDVANPGVNYSYYITAFNEHGEGIATGIFFGMSIGVPPPPNPVLFKRFNEAIRINWSTGLTGLELFEISTIGIYRDGELIDEISSLQLDYNDTGLENGVDYSYQLSCKNIAGEGNLSSEFIISPAWIPTPPWNLTARKTSSDVTLSWDPPVDERGSSVIGYRTYRREPGEEWVLMTESVEMDWKDKEVEIGTTYEYAIDCYNEMGSSDLSEIASVTIQEQDPPDPPVLKKVEKTDKNSIRLQWEHGTDSEEITFHIYRSLDQDTGFFEVGTSDQSEYLDSDNIILNSTYYYYLTAKDEFGESGPSEIKSVYVEGLGDDDNHSEEDEPFPTWLVVVIVVVLISIIAGTAGIFLIIKKKKENESAIKKDTISNNDYSSEEIPLSDDYIAE